MSPKLVKKSAIIGDNDLPPFVVPLFKLVPPLKSAPGPIFRGQVSYTLKLGVEKENALAVQRKAGALKCRESVAKLGKIVSYGKR